MKIRKSAGDRVFHFFIILAMVLIIVVTLYPFWYVFVASFSNANRLNAVRGVVLWFQGYSFDAYRIIFDDSLIWRAYGNSLIYTTLGTALNILLTVVGAYSLSRRGLKGGSLIMKMLIFTMYFNGGLIPTFLQMDRLGLVNNRLAMIIPGAVSVYNLIIMRTAFLAIPSAMEEAAKIDGAGPLRVLKDVVLPLALPSIMVVGLFYMVGHWNKYFDALIYLRDSAKYPLQLVLRNMLIENNLTDLMGDYSFIDQRIGKTVKYAAIMVSVIPIIAVYPFIQKFFVKGIMVGSVKE